MRPNETVFPYPVLGDLNAIPGEKPDAEAIENIPLKEQLALPYRWTFLPSVKNPDILKLIEEGKAQYMCEVTCTATLLRKCFFAKEPKIEVVIGRKEVNKRVDFAIYVVATQHIADYDNSAASEEYRELAPFDLDVGSPLAIIKFYRWDADLCYEDLTSLRSILQILKNSDASQQYVMLNLEHDYIQILLPAQQHEIFLGKAQTPEFSEILKSSIVLYALQAALQVLPTEPVRRWERALHEYIKHNEAFAGLSPTIDADIPLIAARMLDNPFKRLSDVITKLSVQAPEDRPLDDQEDADDNEED